MAKVQVAVSRGESLSEAFGRVRAAYEAAGQSVHVPVAPVGAGEFAPYFHAADRVGTGSCVVVVATEPWSDERAVEFLNDHFEGLSPDSDLRWEFVSAWPLHALIAYVFGRGPAGRFEAAALALTARKRLDHESAPAFASRCVALVEEHLGMSLDLDTPDAVPHLDALVLHTLRPCEDPSLALQAGTYRPGASLELVGAAFGELIRRGHPDRMRWSAAPEIVGGTFPVLEVDAGVEVTCLLPVDRVFRAYQEGTDRGLARYFNVVVQEVIAEADTQPPEQSWPEILGRVVPVLKPAGWNMAMSVARQHFLPDGPVNNPLVVLAVDHPARISFLLDSRLEELGVTADEAFAQAFENLEARSHNLPARLTPVDVEEVAVLRLDCDDYFNASRALLAPALHAAASLRFSTAGPYLVGIPNRDILLLAAPEDRDQFYIFQSLVRWFHERQPAPISSLCFELGPRGIVGHRDTEGDGI